MSSQPQHTTLYWKALKAICRRLGREEQRCEFTLRILQGADRVGSSTRVLTIQIWTEEDLNSLHTLEVTEDDFQGLKLEQGILVDFGGFPAKIITLLQRCLASYHEDPPRFQAILSIQEGVSVFRVVETNDFNQLPHITLAFRQGNDAAVKSFLAGRLSEVRASHTSLERDFSRAQAEASSRAEQLRDTREQLAETLAAYERHVIEAEARSKSEAADAVKQKSEELMQLKGSLDRQREALEEQLRAEMQRLQARSASMAEELLQLREAKFGVDANLLETSHRAASLEGTLSSLGLECEGLRQKCATAAMERAQSTADCAELRARLLSAEEKLAAQKEAMGEQAHHARGLESALRQLEERCADLKEASAGHEERARAAAAEAAKAARAIEQLTAELQLAKERLRRKSAVLERQEEEIAARGKAIDTAAVDAQALQHAFNRAQQDADARKADCGELQEKLQETLKQQHGQENMIRWLNNQVNELQLHGTTKHRAGALHSDGLRYSSGLGWESRDARRHTPAPQPMVGGLAGRYDSMPSSPKRHTGAAMAEAGALPARETPDVSQGYAAVRKHPSAQPAPATRSEQHHTSLAFSVPAFPMPEQHGRCARPSKNSHAAAAPPSKPRAASLHDRAGLSRLKGGPGQQGLPKAATKGTAPSSTLHVDTATIGHAAASGLRGIPASEPGYVGFAEKVHLRSTTGQSLAAAMEWEACSSASKQAVPC